jgi:hypothetical protein
MDAILISTATPVTGELAFGVSWVRRRGLATSDTRG